MSALKLYPTGPSGSQSFLISSGSLKTYHDLKIAQYGYVDTAAFNRAVFASLRPGGTYFVLDHEVPSAANLEAPAGTNLAVIARLHRIAKA